MSTFSVSRTVLSRGLARCPLGIEQDYQAGETVFGFEVVVVQQPACDAPAVLVTQ